jgi:hypothetical protein
MERGCDRTHTLLVLHYGPTHSTVLAYYTGIQWEIPTAWALGIYRVEYLCRRTTIAARGSRSPEPAARRICRFNPSRRGSTALPLSLQTLPSLPLQRHARCPPPMPLTLPFRAVFAASAVALSCCACLLALLKSALRAECPAPGGSSHRPVVIVCVVAAALCLVASAAHLVKSRAWTQAAALCSKWQPVYFVIVSVQRLVLTAIVAYAVVTGSGRAGSCSLESEYENAVHAIS